MSHGIRYKNLEFGIGLAGTRKPFALPKDKPLKKAAAFNKSGASAFPRTTRSKKK